MKFQHPDVPSLPCTTPYSVPFPEFLLFIVLKSESIPLHVHLLPFPIVDWFALWPAILNWSPRKYYRSSYYLERVFLS